jgi:two-component system sensor histidine kinase TtrS
VAEREPARQIEIGVLSHRGDAVTQRNWGPTADYLTQQLPRHCFRIKPLGFDEVGPAVAAGRVDFLLANPGIYVDLEVRHRISRIATIRNGVGQHERNLFGGVIFTRRDHPSISRLADVKGKRLMAVHPDSLGGYLMALDVLRSRGIRVPKDIASIRFAGIHDKVVLAVRDGRTDVGIVRTDILEQMDQKGLIELSRFRVLGQRSDPELTLLHSTPLYPEWPFSTLQRTDNRLAQQVAIALMQMPRDDPAALAGSYSGWTVPLDYRPVHSLLRELKHRPYDQPKAFTLVDALRRYWLVVVLGVAALLIMIALTSRLQALNARLNRAKSTLEQRQQLILNSVAEGIYGVDLNGRTTFVNRAVERMTGWEAHQLIGCNQHQVLHHSHCNGTAHGSEDCPVYATFRDQRPRFIEDDLFWRRDGSSFPVEYSTTPIRDANGRTVGSVVVFRDTTERRDAAERIRRLEVEQARVARLSTLGEMASGIAHELNQPLTAITTNARACVRLIEDGRGNMVRCSEIMTKIAEQAERAGEIIRHLRRFVRKEAPEVAPVRVAELFDTVKVLLHQDARQHRVALTIEIDEGVDAVMVQRTQIEQVILNLARNAIEAMSETPGSHLLRMSASRLEEDGADRVRLCIQDNGPGIPERVRECLFEPFVTTKQKGLGLGLSISAGIVETHGGRLSAAAAEAGAQFQFTLPVAASVSPSEPNTAQPAITQSTGVQSA